MTVRTFGIRLGAVTTDPILAYLLLRSFRSEVEKLVARWKSLGLPDLSRFVTMSRLEVHEKRASVHGILLLGVGCWSITGVDEERAAF